MPGIRSEIAPLIRSNLGDELAEAVVQLIKTGGYGVGDKLPSIMRMARSFGVGHPTLREALQKLEVMGIVEIRHGSGVYVGKNQGMIVISNAVFGGPATRKLLLDLLEARMSIELHAVSLAATQASKQDLRKMDEALESSRTSGENSSRLLEINNMFHRQMAIASGNTVLAQLNDVMTGLFKQQQRTLLDMYGGERHYQDHIGILDALRLRDAELARERVLSHLEGLRAVMVQWEP